MSAQPLPDWAMQWLERARSDLILCQFAQETPGVKLEDACFHAQQCAEKALKALLSEMDIPYPRTHAIDLLLGLLINNGVPIPTSVDESFQLSQYAVQARYPGDWEPVTKEEAKNAQKLATDLLDWVQDQIDKKG